VAAYRIFIKPSARKELDAVGSRDDRRRLVARIQSLANDPRPPGCRKLSGAEKYRVRQGNYRIIYTIEDDRLIVLVVQVGHRQVVYRRAGS
jgi:mRNA interferase RelE/StbE